MRTTSTRIPAVDADITEFLRRVERITFSEVPSHQPDQKFVEELTRVLMEAQGS